MPHTLGLESYLTTCGIERVEPLAGGGGHPKKHKMTLFLEGGVAVAAKAGADADMLKRAKREVAAWVLACEMGLQTLVPTTVLRKMPVSIDSDEKVDGSAQLLWPRFSTALDKSIDVRHVNEHVAMQIAVFDSLAANSDRSNDNWGIIEQLPHVVLIDHGHAFETPSSDSPFVLTLKDELLSPLLLKAVQRFADGQDRSRLRGLLGDTELNEVFDRARLIAANKKLAV
jgi:hypothetical protein